MSPLFLKTLRWNRLIFSSTPGQWLWGQICLQTKYLLSPQQLLRIKEQRVSVREKLMPSGATSGAALTAAGAPWKSEKDVFQKNHCVHGSRPVWLAQLVESRTIDLFGALLFQVQCTIPEVQQVQVIELLGNNSWSILHMSVITYELIYSTPEELPRVSQHNKNRNQGGEDIESNFQGWLF